MNTLINALQTNSSHTENGMVTNNSSLNLCVDLFFTIGAMRGQDESRIINSFIKAFNENAQNALRILFWSRDIRGGAGERDIFKKIIKYLGNNHSDILLKNLIHIPKYGRWDDLLVLFNTKLDNEVKTVISNSLKSNDGLCAKWMPRKGKEAIALEKFLKLTPKEYRKLLVNNTKVVETLMCDNKWNDITYEHVPSLAISRYSNTFDKHDKSRFDLYKNSNTTTINTKSIYPYDILKTIKYGDITLANKQWNSLPNYLDGNTERILPVCDTSGSMVSKINNKSKINCIDICVSLGLYISEKNEGIFKDAFITFSDSPSLQYLKGNLNERYTQLINAEWEMSTNLEAVFDLILNKAIENSLPEYEMPTMILIMSDMEFNAATKNSDTALNLIKNKYIESGYTIPKIVFWNIQSRNSNNYPCQIKDNDTALISGFSPSILKSLLGGDDISPLSIMNKTINSGRYDEIIS